MQINKNSWVLLTLNSFSTLTTSNDVFCYPEKLKPLGDFYICVQFPRILHDSTAHSNSFQLSPQNWCLLSTLHHSWDCCFSSYLSEAIGLTMGLFVLLYSSFKWHTLSKQPRYLLTDQREIWFLFTASEICIWSLFSLTLTLLLSESSDNLPALFFNTFLIFLI